jgi:limbic system-associated membrane protein
MSLLQNWGLKIKSVQQHDAGFYECQVSSHPPTSIFIELRIVGN